MGFYCAGGVHIEIINVIISTSLNDFILKNFILKE